MTQDRLLSDDTPNPGYIVEWTVGLSPRRSLSTKYVQGLKKEYSKFYGRNYDILSDQKEYTVLISPSSK